MSIAIHALEHDGFARFLTTCEAAFGHTAGDESIARLGRVVATNRMIYAADGADMVGTAGAFRFSLSVPGGEVPSAGVTMVGVLPSHRRKGVLSAMMRRQLDDIRSWKEPLALLWASEAGIYQRYGYGLAALGGDINVARDRAAWRIAPEPYGSIRLVDAREGRAHMAAVYEAVRGQRPGMPARSDAWWDAHRMPDPEPEEERHGGGPRWQAVLSAHGEPEAYALYRVHAKWLDGSPHGRLEVIETAAANARAEQAMWSFLLGVDLVGEVEAYHLPVDCALLHQMREPRRLRFVLGDCLWLRIVDAPAALAARTYGGNGRLVLDLHDVFCPWNSGCYELEVTDGKASVARSEAEPDLRLDAADLGAIYLGGPSVAVLVAAGRIAELTPGSAGLAARLFASERAPWCPEIF